jgi:hypothetical protein
MWNVSAVEVAAIAATGSVTAQNRRSRTACSRDEKTLPGESETAEPEAHHGDAHRRWHPPDEAQPDERRGQADHGGERDHSRTAPVDRPSPAGQQEPAGPGAEQIGDRQLQTAEARAVGEVIGEDADAFNG